MWVEFAMVLQHRLSNSTHEVHLNFCFFKYLKNSFTIDFFSIVKKILWPPDDLFFEKLQYPIFLPLSQFLMVNYS